MRRLAFSLMFGLALVGFAFAAVMAPFSVMAFDKPGSSDQWEPWAVAIGMVTMPVLFLVLIVAGALLVWRGWTRSAAMTLLAPATLGVLALSMWAKVAMQ